MATIDKVDTFVELADAHLLDEPPGVLFHAMLQPARYPGDRAATQAMIDNPDTAPPLIDEDYVRLNQRLLLGAKVTQRLVVAHGPTQPEMHDEAYLRLLQNGYQELQDRGLEEVRVAWYGNFIRRLEDTGDVDSPFVESYLRGIALEEPKSGFWVSMPWQLNRSVDGWRYPSLVGMMHYNDIGFAGIDVSTGPFSRHLMDYVAACREVFESPNLSTNIANLFR
jgi:hypothetical protein